MALIAAMLLWNLRKADAKLKKAQEKIAGLEETVSELKGQVHTAAQTSASLVDYHRQLQEGLRAASDAMRLAGIDVGDGTNNLVAAAKMVEFHRDLKAAKRKASIQEKSLKKRLLRPEKNDQPEEVPELNSRDPWE